MNEAIKEVEQTQSGRQEDVDQLYVDAQKLCQEMIKQGL